MTTASRLIVVVVLSLVCLTKPIKTNQPNLSASTTANAKVAVIPCKGTIDDGLYQSIRRRTQTALDQGANYLIYEISTYGGTLKAADNISKYFIFEAAKNAQTVAYVTTEAISAGAMISVSCQTIIMRRNTTIGDCAPIQLGGKLEGVEREKAESFTRAAFERAAEANHYPASLLKAMVTMQIEVYRVKNLRSGRYEFFESDSIPTDPNIYNLAEKQLVDRKDQILTLTSARAFEYGLAAAEVNDRSHAINFLAGSNNVTFQAEPIILETNWSEQMVRWLNSPVVMSILVMLALLGVYIEFNTPGLGLPGLTAVICFAIIIGSKYLVGLANWVEVTLFVIGVLLLLLEIFVIPGFGVAGFLGILCLLAGIFGMLIKNPPEKLPWPQTNPDWQLFINNLLGLLAGFAGFIVLASLLAKYLPRLQFFGRLILAPGAANRPGPMQISMTAPHDIEPPPLSPGETGRVISTLRPTGKAQFGNSIVDVVAESEFIEKNTEVRVTQIHGNRVVVKPVDEPLEE